MLILKKLAYRIACNNFTGSIISKLFRDKVPDLRWPGFRFCIPGNVDKVIHASVFWGFYESAEIRFIEKYLRNDVDVVELGGSLGIVSSHIVGRLGNGRRLFTVELNPTLIEVIKENISRHNHSGVVAEQVNKAISYDRNNLRFNITGNNTETSVYSSYDSNGCFEVETTKLSEIVNAELFKEFALVADIEGAEVEVISEDAGSFENCHQLFIELHDVNYKGMQYKVEALASLITAKSGLRVVDKHGPVFYFSR
jgi:FkbM family methyltransferase